MQIAMGQIAICILNSSLLRTQSSDAHDGHVTRLVSLRSAGLCKCLGSESARRTGHLVGLRRLDGRYTG